MGKPPSSKPPHRRASKKNAAVQFLTYWSRLAKRHPDGPVPIRSEIVEDLDHMLLFLLGRLVANVNTMHASYTKKAGTTFPKHAAAGFECMARCSLLADAHEAGSTRLRAYTDRIGERSKKPRAARKGAEGAKRAEAAEGAPAAAAEVTSEA